MSALIKSTRSSPFDCGRVFLQHQHHVPQIVTGAQYLTLDQCGYIKLQHEPVMNNSDSDECLSTDSSDGSPQKAKRSSGAQSSQEMAKRSRLEYHIATEPRGEETNEYVSVHGSQDSLMSSQISFTDELNGTQQRDSVESMDRQTDWGSANSQQWHTTATACHAPDINYRKHVREKRVKHGQEFRTSSHVQLSSSQESVTSPSEIIFDMEEKKAKNRMYARESRLRKNNKMISLELENTKQNSVIEIYRKVITIYFKRLNGGESPTWAQKDIRWYSSRDGTESQLLSCLLPVEDESFIKELGNNSLGMIIADDLDTQCHQAQLQTSSSRRHTFSGQQTSVPAGIARGQIFLSSVPMCLPLSPTTNASSSSGRTCEQDTGAKQETANHVNGDRPRDKAMVVPKQSAIIGRVGEISQRKVAAWSHASSFHEMGTHMQTTKMDTHINFCDKIAIPTDHSAATIPPTFITTSVDKQTPTFSLVQAVHNVMREDSNVPPSPLMAEVHIPSSSGTLGRQGVLCITDPVQLTVDYEVTLPLQGADFTATSVEQNEDYTMMSAGQEGNQMGISPHQDVVNTVAQQDADYPVTPAHQAVDYTMTSSGRVTHHAHLGHVDCIKHTCVNSVGTSGIHENLSTSSGTSEAAFVSVNDNEVAQPVNLTLDSSVRNLCPDIPEIEDLQPSLQTT